MATIRELPSGRFNVQVRRHNCKTQSKTFDTTEEAKAWIQEVEGVPVEEDLPLLTFLELGHRYCSMVLAGKSSRSITQGRMERIAAQLPEDARKINKYDVNEYRLMRLAKVSPVTVREELQIINRIYRWAHRELILDRDTYPSPVNEVAMPSPSKPRNRIVTREELNILLSALSTTMGAIVELAYETAMRRGELVKLKPKHLHLEERYLSVEDGKTGDRLVPLTNRAVELLRESLSRCPGPEARLFPVTALAVSVAFRRSRRHVGLDEDVRLHQLRHTRITEVAKKGFNQAQIMMVSGHRDVRSVQRYTHLNVKDVIKLLE